jgi:hypothetical protein
MELNECYCGRLFRLAEDYRDHLPCAAADLAKVRAHPEYQAMLRNLTDTQERCKVLLLALRDARSALTDEGYTEKDQLVQEITRALNPPPKAPDDP